jgi:dihydrofolate reductase
MPKLLYSMSVSLDGYIAGPSGDFSWSAPDEELFRFHTDRVAGLGAHLLGRRLYETMLYWETAEPDGADEQEFARLWQALPKLVFSTTLTEVEGNARLATGSLADEVAALGEQTVEIGGAGLAAEAARENLIDEYLLFVHPVIVGGGTPYFPPLTQQIDLELVETRTFASKVVYVRYRRV